MISINTLQSLHTRIANAVNVSGALDNCFFHSYAAYLLSNKLPLPQDLFKPQVGKKSPGEQLKNVFKSANDLELFNSYNKQRYPNADSSEMLAEKTLVLGILFREWFADKLAENKTNEQQLFDNSDTSKISFLKIIDAYRELGEEMVLADDRMAPIVEANRTFFTNLKHIPQENEIEHFQAYWQEQGYKNYCDYLANPGVKVSITDVEPVLQTLNTPYTLYSRRDGSVTAQNTGGPNQPRFELVIAEKAAHYLLLKDDNTQQSLDNYAVSLEQYRADREAILAMPEGPTEKLAACAQMPSQLVAVICPEKDIAKDHVQALVETVNTIKSQSAVVAAQQIEQATPVEQEAPDKSQSYKNEVKTLIEAARRGDFATDPSKAIAIENIDQAQALEGETDEEFATRLQDAEYKSSGLK